MKTLAITPTWAELWHPSTAEKELTGFYFKGPGLYLTNTDTLLVLPYELPHPAFKNCWMGGQDPKANFWFQIFNCTYEETYLWHVSGIPIKVDERFIRTLDLSKKPKLKSISEYRCGTCNGQGKLWVGSKKAALVTCPACDGKGNIVTKKYEAE